MTLFGSKDVSFSPRISSFRSVLNTFNSQKHRNTDHGPDHPTTGPGSGMNTSRPYNDTPHIGFRTDQHNENVAGSGVLGQKDHQVSGFSNNVHICLPSPMLLLMCVYHSNKASILVKAMTAVFCRPPNTSTTRINAGLVKHWLARSSEQWGPLSAVMHSRQRDIRKNSKCFLSYSFPLNCYLLLNLY
jgi:hypothetical protein